MVVRGQAIPDTDHVSRYCKPSVVENGLPLVGAFVPRPTEEFVSVNWLEYLDSENLAFALEKVRARFQSRGYDLRLNGRFVVLGVGRSRVSASEIQRQIHFEHLPLQDDDSHSGIFGIDEDDLAIAAEIVRLVGPDDVHPAV